MWHTAERSHPDRERGELSSDAVPVATILSSMQVRLHRPEQILDRHARRHPRETRQTLTLGCGGKKESAKKALIRSGDELV